MKYVVFATNLKAVLERRGLSQKELAQAAGISEACVSRYINGSRRPNFSAMGKLCHALKTTPNELLRGTYERA